MKTALTLAIFFISFTASSQRLMTSVISSFGGSTNNSGLGSVALIIFQTVSIKISLPSKS